MADGVTWDDRALMSKLKEFNPQIDRFLSFAVAFHATRAASYARSNAPWTDRTGNARNGLFAKAESDLTKHRIIISHSVPYGVWLEVRFSGRYQIIRPTVDHEGVQLMRTIQTMFRRMSGS